MDQEKYQVLRVSMKTMANTIIHSYTFRAHILESVDHAKCIGGTVSGNLKWDRHITNCVKKANSTRVVLKRNMSIPSKSIKFAVYTDLFRSHLEYCSTVGVYKIR